MALTAGDIALIIGCKNNPINIGNVCTLAHMISPDEKYINPAGKLVFYRGDVKCWVVTGAGLMASLSNELRPLDYTLVQSKHLMPLRGDNNSEGEIDSIPMTAFGAIGP